MDFQTVKPNDLYFNDLLRDLFMYLINVAYKLWFSFNTDKEAPKKLSCPDDIEVKTSAAKTRVSWTVPTYSDNCGNYSECAIKISSNIQPNEEFNSNTKTEIIYTATDPSGNENKDCIFLVTMKSKHFLLLHCTVI